MRAQRHSAKFNNKMFDGYEENKVESETLHVVVEFLSCGSRRRRTDYKLTMNECMYDMETKLRFF